ncbi:N-acetyl-gamma-glutamyl-phosphate reductase [Actinomadura sp. DC4]|uniref:N-acetyl-gamma-glutamyl-phosphate reductase n=1 Tax=Actinomadura sp. DC4 TaxID=3055069 RepID=UPI0025AFF282|nr:N-acetyl-gamma-glutamyl-phosphate reductase [Actinomadura sp. DC4]MDN3356271.1 N-acetyl-gamma-glutamyl-phosphate reductase [Actinomadura sp. DC4]
MIRAGVLGAAGYLGGELLRLLTGHPRVEVGYAVSTRFPGRRVDAIHPNLRGHTAMTFCGADELGECDVVFCATPHTATMKLVPGLDAPLVIDLSGDFRLRDPAVYERYYGTGHTAPELLAGFTTGCPELFRERLRTADRVSVPGCGANAAILALAPVAGLVEGPARIDVRTGSSGSGASAGAANLHAERSGAMRVFAPVGHRHEAEVAQATGLDARMTATGVEAVRGVQVLCHLTPRGGSGLDEKAIRRAYRTRYAGEPFVRIIAHRQGVHRLPDPKILLGSNHCDVGFAADGDRVTVVAALDNLMKGGSGNAVQCLNIRMGWPERLGLEFPGLHPI